MTLPETGIKTRDAIDIASPDTALPNPASPETALPIVTADRPSRLRRMGSAIARHPRLIQSVVLLILLAGTSSFLLYSLFRGAWSPEKDNKAILQTIFAMETERKDALPIDQNSPQQIVTRSYADLEPYVEADGWTWINRFGSTITYGRQDQRLIASCSAYSPLYLVCNLSEIP